MTCISAVCANPFTADVVRMKNRSCFIAVYWSDLGAGQLGFSESLARSRSFPRAVFAPLDLPALPDPDGVTGSGAVQSSCPLEPPFGQADHDRVCEVRKALASVLRVHPCGQKVEPPVGGLTPLLDSFRRMSFFL